MLSLIGSFTYYSRPTHGSLGRLLHFSSAILYRAMLRRAWMLRQVVHLSVYLWQWVCDRVTCTCSHMIFQEFKNKFTAD